MDFSFMERWIFWAEWYREEASLAKPFYLYYFPGDGSVELYDPKQRKTFLKRTIVDGLIESDFHIGAKLNIFGRLIEILDYADTLTNNKLSTRRESTLCLVKPEAIEKIGGIIKTLLKSNFLLARMRMVKLETDEAVRFYPNKCDHPALPFLVENLSSGSCVAMEIIGDNAVEKLKKLCGPDDPDEAKLNCPETLRADFGCDRIRNGLHCSENLCEARRELNFFFLRDSQQKWNFKTTEVIDGTSLCIIKPHAIKEKLTGDIIAMIVDSGFKITAMKMLLVERHNCEEFLEVYKSVVPEYAQMVLQLSSGPCIAIEVLAKSHDVNTHLALRALCGPSDPEIGRQIRPETIRAKFGHDRIKNAIHCTDLADDTKLDIEYIFKILE